MWADLLALDTDDVRLEGFAGDSLLDVFVFAGRDGLVTDLWSAGRHIVQSGRHIARDATEAAFRATMRCLRAGL
jgi:formimidoylglutamate deiminase